MMWKYIDSLSNRRLEERGAELILGLDSASGDEILAFHTEAVDAYQKVFNKESFIVYCIIFAGEDNESGFIDFCSNILLSGSSNYSNFLSNPDCLSTYDYVSDYNEDNGLDVSSVCFTILDQRNDVELIKTLTRIDERAGVKSIWDGLSSSLGGTLKFSPNWSYARTALPMTYHRYKR